MSRTNLTFICDCCVPGHPRVFTHVMVGRRKVYFEFTQVFGPLITDRHGEPLDDQPVLEDHPFWKPFNAWLAAHRAG